MTNTRILAATLAAALVGAIASTSSVDAGRGARHASATFVDPTGEVVGTVRLVEDSSGTLHVTVHADGLTPGEHGTHIHSVASCTPSFGAAGGHHDPRAVPHGQHAGDLPNLRVNVAGRGHLAATTEKATLSDGRLSVFDVDGSSVVVHAQPDDFVGQPAGNSGARIACGVITADI